MSVAVYPAYQDSGLELLGDIPSFWQVTRVKMVLSRMGSGGTPDTDKESYWTNDENGVPWVAIGDMSDRDSLHETKKRLTAEGLASKGLKVWPSGTLLFSMYASLGHVCETTIPAAVNQAILAMVPGASINQAFLKRWFEHLRPQLKQQASSNTQDNLNAAKVANLPVVLPPLEDQTAIAAFLERETRKIDALMDAQLRLINFLKEKRQAVISHSVTRGLDPTVPTKYSGVEWLGDVPAHWQVRNIASLSSKITNGFVGPTRDILVDDGVRYLQSLHIKNGTIKFDTPYFVAPHWSDARKKSILAKGDVLIVQTGDIGQVAVVPDEFVGCNCHALIIVTPHRDLLSGDWLSLALRSDYGQSSLLSIQTGALHPHLNCGNVKFVMIPVPPPSEQSEIIERVISIATPTDALIAKAQEGIALLNERRAALISAAVTGKIDVRGIVPDQAEAA